MSNPITCLYYSTIFTSFVYELQLSSSLSTVSCTAIEWDIGCCHRSHHDDTNPKYDRGSISPKNQFSSISIDDSIAILDCCSSSNAIDVDTSNGFKPTGDRSRPSRCEITPIKWRNTYHWFRQCHHSIDWGLDDGVLYSIAGFPADVSMYFN